MTFEKRPKGDKFVEEVVNDYLKTLDMHQQKLKATSPTVKTTSPAGNYIPGQDRGRLLKEGSLEAKYRDRSRSRSIEYEKRGYFPVPP